MVLRDTHRRSSISGPFDGFGGAGHGKVGDLQRRRILGAMVEVANEHGAANVTVAHVIDRSRVSRRTFYEIFNDREDCLLAALDDAFSRAQACALRDYDPDRSWAERVRAGLTDVLRFFDQEPGAARLLVVESLAAGHEALDRRDRVLAQLTATIDEGRQETKNDPPALTAEGIVGGVIAVIHSRLISPTTESMLTLLAPLMSMIVLPYLGPSAARRELQRPNPIPQAPRRTSNGDPLRGVGMRLTYRTVCVLSSVGEHPGSSNRDIGTIAGVNDQGQISKLLSRLHRLGLVQNNGAGSEKGAPNEWTLTERGMEIERVIAAQTD